MLHYIPEIGKCAEVPDSLDVPILWPAELDALPETPNSVWRIVQARQDARNRRWDAERRRKAQDAATARQAAVLDVEDVPGLTDADRLLEDLVFEPTAEDLAELHKLFDDERAEDWLEFSRWAERVDAMARAADLEPEHLARMVPGCCHESALI